MNRSSGVLQSSPVQQMMVGSPNWWNMINSMRPPLPHQPSPSNLLPSHYYTPPSSLPFSSSSSTWYDNSQDQLPESWSQLLLGRLVGEEEKGGLSHFQAKKLENWEDQILHGQTSNIVDIKQESSASSYGYGHEHSHVEYEAPKPTWSQMMPAANSSSPNKSCVTTTTLSTNILDFSNKVDRKHPPSDRSASECNSIPNGGALKKARVQPSSTQSTFKVRKEKLGDRITALHQLVSPFGKTDTASVLSEAIGYIRFLQSQVEALSLPYLGSGSPNMRQQQPIQGERTCLFPEDPGQLLNDNCMKRKGASDQKDFHEEPKDLRSRGLCLVPLSCTFPVGSENGADYWASAVGGGGGLR